MILGVTGGVGSGKSAVLDYLAEEKGALVIKADEVARRISETEGPALSAIKELFKDDDVLTGDGLMDRDRVAKLIFHDDEKRIKLEKILHGATADEIKSTINNSLKEAPDRLIVLESAIFFESGCDRFCDKVLYVHADKKTRFERIKASRGYSEEKFNSILIKQMSEEGFREKCDITVDNSGDFEATKKQLEEYLLLFMAR